MFLLFEVEWGKKEGKGLWGKELGVSADIFRCMFLVNPYGVKD